MQPKKQLKVQYIGIFEEIDSFYWPKMHFLKKGQKIRAWVDSTPPLIWTMSERKRFFSIDAFPNEQNIRLIWPDYTDKTRVLTKVNYEVVPQYLGRRLTLMLVTPASYLLSFVSILFANSVALIFIGRWASL